MRNDVDFKARIQELFRENFNSDRIKFTVKREFNINLENYQIETLRVKYGNYLQSKTIKSRNLNKIILYYIREKKSNQSIKQILLDDHNIMIDLNTIEQLRLRFETTTNRKNDETNDFKSVIYKLFKEKFSNEEIKKKLLVDLNINMEVTKIQRLKSKYYSNTKPNQINQDSFNFRIIQLFQENLKTLEIINLLKQEFDISITEDNLEKLKKKHMIQGGHYATSLHDKILNILENQSKPISAREICSLIKQQYGDFIGTKKMINETIWSNLKDKVEYNKHTFEYSLKTNIKENKYLNFLNSFQINRNVHLANEIKLFIELDSTLLISGYKTIDKLVNSFIYKPDVTALDMHFLHLKLKEYELDISVLDRKSVVKLGDFHKIEDFIHIIFEDHIIKEYELAYIKQNFDKNDMPDSIGNKRFWQIGLYYYFNDLRKIKGFDRLIKIWYVLIQLDLPENNELITSFGFIDIYCSTNIQDIINFGNALLAQRLKDALNKQNNESNYWEADLDELLNEINDLSFTAYTNNFEIELNDYKKIKRESISISKVETTYEKNSNELISDLSLEEVENITNYIKNGNRLSAFFKYSNCVANKYSRKEIDVNFEILWDSLQ